MRLLVTGGAGFIGTNFVKYILRKYSDYEVLNLDKLTYAGNLENLKDLEGNQRHRFVRGDICDASVVERLVGEGVDAIVNFAAETHVDRSIEEPTAFVITNILGTQTLLTIAEKHKVRRYLQVSTDEVYGSLGEKDLFRETTPLAPSSPYSASKAAADLLVQAHYSTYELPGITTRCSNNYGPFQFPEKLLPLLISNAMNDQPLPIYGDGRHIRDWLYVEDHCRAIDLVLHRGKPGQVYNIGGGNEHQNLQVARLVLEILDKPESLITFVKDRPGHDRRYAIDASKIQNELGWCPVTPFEEGLRKTIAWYQNNKKWVADIQQGEYQNYYQKMYVHRDETLLKRL
ncbi:MAG: dTDP-glucose 4,6-dehydratase [Acidobacteria bacterium]|nr:MAG: dTDP-glucose 4,6-dehydratase [Acidobacteriota bacterium]